MKRLLKRPDDLRQRRPAPPSRSGTPSGRRFPAGYLLLFLVSFALCFTGFCARAHLEGMVNQAVRRFSDAGVSIRGLSLQGPIPSLRADSMSLPLGRSGLLISDPRLELSLLSLSATLSGSMAGGSCSLVWTPDSIFAPTGPAGVRIVISRVLAAKLPLPPAGTLGPCISSGVMSAEGDFRAAPARGSGPLPLEISGRASLSLEDGVLLPECSALKRTAGLRAVQGRAALELTPASLTILACSLAGDGAGLELSGKVTLTSPLPKSALDLRGALRARPETIAEGALPPALLARLSSGEGLPFAVAGTVETPVPQE